MVIVITDSSIYQKIKRKKNPPINLKFKSTSGYNFDNDIKIPIIDSTNGINIFTKIKVTNVDNMIINIIFKLLLTFFFLFAILVRVRFVFGI